MRAADACESCPLLRKCAESALTAGTSLDGHTTAPAAGVIQAGVYCVGDDATAAQLAAIAGVSLPKYRRKLPKPKPPKECKGCGKPLHRWTRGTVPEGFVMHYARGYCCGCRVLYKAAVEQAAAEYE